VNAASKQRPAGESRPPYRKRFFYGIATAIIFFAILELGLRLAGLGAPQIVGELKFGYPEGIPKFDSDGIEREGVFYTEPLFEANERLFWQPRAGTHFTDSNGFRIPGPSSIAAADTYRVMVAGDSCSFLGTRLYPNRFSEMAETRLEQPVDVINASCPGYSSFQGRRRLETLWQWKPNLLVIYFGWNDHWRSLSGYTDEQLFRQREAFGRTRTWLEKSRVYRVLSQLLAGTRPTANESPGTPITVRVPREDYRQNLTDMIASAEEHGCQVMLLTAPTLFMEAQMPSWAFEFFGVYYKMSRAEVEAIPRMHASYNDIVRELAGQSDGAMLVDLARHWNSKDSARRFRRDHIHLSETGHRDAAEAMFRVWSDAIDHPNNVASETTGLPGHNEAVHNHNASE